ncbi:hypothetical protein S40293_03642 [Stachybotrys chartarum IBT 40293]|nr:hypothetical protein S40293_03642 [Stachybotrys chartarum IBT 40293]
MMAGKALGPTVVHVGLNCPDPLAGKANKYAAAGRLLETDLAECLATVAVKAEPVSLPVASFDVGFDDDGRVTETAIGSITDFVGGVKIMREAGGGKQSAVEMAIDLRHLVPLPRSRQHDALILVLPPIVSVYAMSQQPISIIGAGIGGLTLARCLRHHGVPAVVYERMPSIARHSYGITLHASSYKPLLDVLNMDEHAFKRSIAVDGLLGGTGAIDPTAMVSPTMMDSTSFRAHRQKLEKLLSQGLDIQWGHSLERAAETSSGVDLHFQNGRKLEGSRFVGTDGPHSIARKSLSPDTPLSVLPYVAFNGRRRIDRALFESTYGPAMGGSNVMQLRQSDVALNISVNDQQADVVDLGWIYSRPARGPHDLLHNPSRPLLGATEVPKELFAEIEALSNLQQPFKGIFDAEKMKGKRILHWLMRTVLVEPQELHRLAKKGAFFMGDSVHAEPILGGQGANNAITDGIELAKCISTSGVDGIMSWYESRYPAWESGVRSSEEAIAEMHRAIVAHEKF